MVQWPDLLSGSSAVIMVVVVVVQSPDLLSTSNSSNCGCDGFLRNHNWKEHHRCQTVQVADLL